VIRLPVVHSVHEILHVDVGIIQARDLLEALAPGVDERLLTFFADFLKGLEAVGREGGTHDEQILGAFFREGLQTLVGIRRNPLLTGQAGLEGEFVLRLLESSGGHEEARHLDALVAIAGRLTGAVVGTAILHLHAMGLRRITLAEVAFRQSVVREEQLVERLAEPRLG
jgi:hypothetical protein